MTVQLVMIFLVGLGIILFTFFFILFQYLKHLLQTITEANKRQDVLSQQFTNMLQKQSSEFNTRLDNAASIIGGLQRNIGEMSEIGRSMKDLQDYLRNPKLRGSMGEAVLAEMLQQCLPKEMYKLQYSFKNGEKVDALLYVGKQFLSIDAKFPMENIRAMFKQEETALQDQYKRKFIQDVKKHIETISKKYILPNEQTLDYAVMYIPAESVYYEVIQSEILTEFAKEKRILVVSPMSFYAYLRVILMSFQGQSLEKKTQEVLSLLQAMQKDYLQIDESLGILDKHFGNAYNQLQLVNKNFMKMGQKLDTNKLLESSHE